jgi:hypothetical protein
MKLLKYIFSLDYLNHRIAVGTVMGAGFYKYRGRSPMYGALVGTGVTGLTCISLPLTVVVFLAEN